MSLLAGVSTLQQLRCSLHAAWGVSSERLVNYLGTHRCRVRIALKRMPQRQRVENGRVCADRRHRAGHVCRVAHQEQPPCVH